MNIIRSIGFVLIIIDIPSAFPDTVKLCEGVTFGLNTQCPNNYSYQWYKNDTLLTTTSSSNYTVNTGGLYQAKILNCNNFAKLSDSVFVSYTHIPKPPTTSKISLDNFSAIPNYVDECPCHFWEKKNNSKNKNIFFATGFDSIGYVSINNKLTKIRLDSSTVTPETCPDCDYMDFYSSGQYKVIAHINRNAYGRAEDPSTYYGTITIMNTDSNKVTRWFDGECENPDSFYQTTNFKLYTKIKQRITIDWIKIKQRDWVKENGFYSGIDVSLHKCLTHIDPEIYLTYVNDKYGIFFESYRVTDLRNYNDSIVLATDSFNGDSIFNWTFKPISKNKGYWSVYNMQTNKYEELGLFRAKEEE